MGLGLMRTHQIPVEDYALLDAGAAGKQEIRQHERDEQVSTHSDPESSVCRVLRNTIGQSATW